MYLMVAFARPTNTRVRTMTQQNTSASLHASSSSPDAVARTTCLNALQTATDRLGHPPSKREYHAVRPADAPLSTDICQHFTDWEAALHAADLAPPAPATSHTYTPQDCVTALHTVAAELNAPPTRFAYRAHRPADAPSAATIHRRFESWETALRAADLPCPADTTADDADMPSRTTCLTALQQVADELGHPPNRHEYQAQRDADAPSATHITTMFTSWAAACSAAELIHQPTRTYSRRDCLAALQTVAEKLGRSPTQRDYQTHRPVDTPSATTIQATCESWNAAKQAAGLTQHTHQDVTYTRADCLAALTQVADELGESPSVTAYNDARPADAPSAATIQTRFESWNAAKLAAGLEIGTVAEYSRHECQTALEMAATVLGFVPPMAEYDAIRPADAPSAATIRQTFGSWDAAKQTVSTP